MLPILICYSRSGGTLMNRILGSLENVIVLSEVNPWGSFKPMLEQAQEWFCLISAEEKKKLEGIPFAEQIKELHKRAAERGKTIIIRDWSVANFMKGIIKHKKPSFKLETIYELRKYSPKPLVLMRDPYSVWKSNKENFGQYYDFEPVGFFAAYKKYLKAVDRIPRIKLEDFTLNPDSYTEWICNFWGIRYDPSCLKDFTSFTKCTGDNTLAQKKLKDHSIRPVLQEPCRKNMSQRACQVIADVYRSTSYDKIIS